MGPWLYNTGRWQAKQKANPKNANAFGVLALMLLLPASCADDRYNRTVLALTFQASRKMY